MRASLLDFPPELLVHTLSFLPIRSLLNFSETCRYSHSLAKSSLYALSLGIYTTRISGIISCLSGAQYPKPKLTDSLFSSTNAPPVSSTVPRKVRRDSYELNSREGIVLDNQDPYKVSVSIPDAQSFDSTTLLAFHTALTKSILVRHGGVLRNLELSLWTLTIPVAKAISQLSALRALSLRIEDFPHIRSMPRRLVASHHAEQRDAWGILTEKAVWAPRLQALRVEGGELSSAQLFVLLRRSRWCRELWLSKCPLIGKELWSFLGNEWTHGRAALNVLGIMRCGGQLDEDVLDAIGSLDRLQVSKPLPDRLVRNTG